MSPRAAITPPPLIALARLPRATTTRTAAGDHRNFIATPGMIKAELNLTNEDILALGRDIRTAFRRPFEEQREAALARFVREFGRMPGMGIPSKGPGDPGVGLSPTKDANGRHSRVRLTLGVNDFISSERDFATVHGWMQPPPTGDDVRYMSYHGSFVHNFGEFEREWEAWHAEHSGLGSRMWGGTRDTAIDYRKRAKLWREQFLALGGVTYAPEPMMPTPRAPFFGDLDIGSTFKTIAIIGAGAVAALVVLPPLIRSSRRES